MTIPEKTIFVPFIHAFGGVERLLLALSEFLHMHGQQHAIICFSKSIDLAAHADWPVPVRELKPARHPLAEGYALRQYFRRATKRGMSRALVFDLKGAFYAGFSECDRYVLHLTDPPSLLPSDISKHALTLRDQFPPASRRSTWRQALHAELVHRINRRGVRRASAVAAMTTTIANELTRLYGVSPRIVRPGVPAPTQAPAYRMIPRRKPLRLLSVSRLEPNKRIDWILRAFADPESGTSDAVLDVVGDGSQMSELQRLAMTLDIDRRVVFHGRVSDSRLREIYNASHLFLMPAVQGYGLPALEALASGMPVILHRESGVAEILCDTKWANVINGSSESLPKALHTLLCRVRSNALQDVPIPYVPTDQEWAREICDLCDWI